MLLFCKPGQFWRTSAGALFAPQDGRSVPHFPWFGALLVNFNPPSSDQYPISTGLPKAGLLFLGRSSSAVLVSFACGGPFAVELETAIVLRAFSFLQG